MPPAALPCTPSVPALAFLCNSRAPRARGGSVRAPGTRWNTRGRRPKGGGSLTAPPRPRLTAAPGMRGGGGGDGGDGDGASGPASYGAAGRAEVSAARWRRRVGAAPTRQVRGRGLLEGERPHGCERTGSGGRELTRSAAELRPAAAHLSPRRGLRRGHLAGPRPRPAAPRPA